MLNYNVIFKYELNLKKNKKTQKTFVTIIAELNKGQLQAKE
jgi:hypothetical protein